MQLQSNIPVFSYRIRSIKKAPQIIPRCLAGGTRTQIDTNFTQNKSDFPQHKITCPGPETRINTGFHDTGQHTMKHVILYP